MIILEKSKGWQARLHNLDWMCSLDVFVYYLIYNFVFDMLIKIRII
jgi:hypothetical protein